MPPETAGGTQTRYSRTPHSIILTYVNEFADEQGHPVPQKGKELMNRVIVAFGDDSAQEFEGAHVALEGVSQIVTKIIEDCRIGGSPIEKSTRYVRFDIQEPTPSGGRQWQYVRPQEVIDAGLLPAFEAAMDRSFEVYSEALQRLEPYYRERFPKDKFQVEIERDGTKVTCGWNELLNEKEQKAFNQAYRFVIRGAACDSARGLLPTATKTNFGIFANGRYFTHLLSKLKSDDLAEARDRAERLEVVLSDVMPTFISRNARDPKREERNRHMLEYAKIKLAGMTPVTDELVLLPRDQRVVETLAACLYPYTSVSMRQLHSFVERLMPHEQEFLFQMYVGRRDSRRDRTPRGIEAGYPYTFDIIGTFAEYRDLQRHRMCTQQRQQLTTDFGFFIPPELIDVGLEQPVIEAEQGMRELNKLMMQHGLYYASQYATLLNHRMRWTMGMNLREVQHLAELRSGVAGHYGYRKIAMAMARAVLAEEPWAAPSLSFVCFDDPENRISRAREQGRIAGKALERGVELGENW